MTDRIEEAVYAESPKLKIARPLVEIMPSDMSSTAAASLEHDDASLLFPTLQKVREERKDKILKFQEIVEAGMDELKTVIAKLETSLKAMQNIYDGSENQKTLDWYAQTEELRKWHTELLDSIGNKIVTELEIRGIHSYLIDKIDSLLAKKDLPKKIREMLKKAKELLIDYFIHLLPKMRIAGLSEGLEKIEAAKPDKIRIAGSLAKMEKLIYKTGLIQMQLAKLGVIQLNPKDEEVLKKELCSRIFATQRKISNLAYNGHLEWPDEESAQRLHDELIRLKKRYYQLRFQETNVEEEKREVKVPIEETKKPTTPEDGQIERLDPSVTGTIGSDYFAIEKEPHKDMDEKGKTELEGAQAKTAEEGEGAEAEKDQKESEISKKEIRIAETEEEEEIDLEIKAGELLSEEIPSTAKKLKIWAIDKCAQFKEKFGLNLTRNMIAVQVFEPAGISPANVKNLVYGQSGSLTNEQLRKVKANWKQFVAQKLGYKISIEDEESVDEEKSTEEDDESSGKQAKLTLEQLKAELNAQKSPKAIAIDHGVSQGWVYRLMQQLSKPPPDKEEEKKNVRNEKRDQTTFPE